MSKEDGGGNASGGTWMIKEKNRQLKRAEEASESFKKAIQETLSKGQKHDAVREEWQKDMLDRAQGRKGVKLSDIIQGSSGEGHNIVNEKDPTGLHDDPEWKPYWKRED
ncbi:MAG: hypothetical protein ACXAEN_26130 [Candidatus Thorarchaeota archaeon]|jgi:hypothetical protein